MGESTSGKVVLGRHDWVQLHLSLLEEERKAEIQAAQIQVEGVSARTLEARGVLLAKLVVGQRSTGLYGRPLVTFVPQRKDATLPANKFSAGDIAGVCEGGQQVCTGVVVEVGERRVVVAGEEEGKDDLDALEDDSHFTLRKLASQVTYKRIKAGLLDLAGEVSTPSSHLLSLLFGECPPHSPSPRLPPQLISPSGDLLLFNECLDRSQREAVEFSLMRSDLAVIHGPPGTGKTTTLVEVVRQHVKLGCKVLVCAPSNLAVDNLVERLAVAKVRLVRLGHPARVTPLTQRHTLDAILHNSEEWCVLGDIRTEMEGELARMRKARGGDQRRHIRSNIKSLRKELRERETKLVRQVLAGSEVILTTLTSSTNEGPLRHLPATHLDLVVIDECSQATEASCHLAIMRAGKAVLAGDHCQLPPTIVSPIAASKGLDRTLMERVIDECGGEVVRMLTQQYRMNSIIMRWCSDAMYQGRLTAHPSVSSHLLSHLPGVTPTEETENVAVVVDTAGCGCWELDTGDAQSKGNSGEAVLVYLHVQALVQAGVKQQDIAVITPYNLQVELVRGLVSSTYPLVEVRSVDGFQGREKEAVVVSLVRSNKQGTVGFLSEDRRLNVAISRARRHIAIIGDSETTGRHPFIHDLLEYMCLHGVVKTAHEFQYELDNTEVHTPDCLTTTTTKPQTTKNPAKPNKNTPARPNKTNNNNKERNKTKPKPTEEENLKRKEEYLGLLNNFLASSNLSYSFPTNLNSYERRLIHQLCDELCLDHCSEGVEKERHIVVKKPPAKQHRTEEEEEKEECKEEEEKKEEEKEKKEEEEKEECNEKQEKEEVVDSKEEEEEEKEEHNEKQEEIATPNITKNVKKIKTRNEKPEKIRVSENTKGKKQKIRISEITKDENVLLPSPQQVETVANDTHSHSDTQTGTRPKTQQHNSVTLKKRTKYVGGEYVMVEEDTNIPLNMRRCGVCGRDVPQQNYSLHSVQCERNSTAPQQHNAAQTITNKENVKKKNNKKKERKNNNNNKKQEEEEEEDFDSLINKFVKDNHTCSQPQCTATTTVICQLCPFCSRTFCLAHHIPEIHGCGYLAHRHARTVISREGVVYPGSGLPSKKSDQDKRKHLERKLAKKMDNFSTQRTAKLSDKKEKEK